MARNVLIIERSPLARNVYSMVLAKMGEVKITNAAEDGLISDVREKARNMDLVIAGQSTIGDRKKEFYKALKELAGNGGVPCIILVRFGARPEWSEFEGLKNTVVIERPFFPEELLRAVKRSWGTK